MLACVEQLRHTFVVWRKRRVHHSTDVITTEIALGEFEIEPVALSREAQSVHW